MESWQLLLWYYYLLEVYGDIFMVVMLLPLE